MANKDPQKPGFWNILLSILAAAFGVQNKKNLERDFKYGSIYIFVFAGILFTVLFVLAVIIVVKLVLSSGGV